MVIAQKAYYRRDEDAPDFGKSHILEGEKTKCGLRRSIFNQLYEIIDLKQIDFYYPLFDRCKKCFRR